VGASTGAFSAKLPRVLHSPGTPIHAAFSHNGYGYIKRKDGDPLFHEHIMRATSWFRSKIGTDDPRARAMENHATLHFPVVRVFTLDPPAPRSRPSTPTELPWPTDAQRRTQYSNPARQTIENQHLFVVWGGVVVRGAPEHLNYNYITSDLWLGGWSILRPRLLLNAQPLAYII
jgi:hypothetical protein